MTPETGFSAVDRETLTTVKVHLGFLVQSMQDALVRIQKLEETRLTARDLAELMDDTDTLRMEKKELEARFTQQQKELETRLALEKKQLEDRVSALEQWTWKVMGAAMMLGGLAGFASKIIFK